MTARTALLAPLFAALSTFALAPLAEARALASASQAPSAPLRYVRAGERGTRALNVPSRDGTSVVSIDAGTVLAVHGERAGFLEVEVPGGLPVYVFGKYAQPSEVDGVLEITGNSLNLRPLPSSDEASFPLAQKLYRGDRVRLLSRTNPALPFEQDWLRVLAPAGVRAWVDAKETAPLEAGLDGAGAFAKAAQAAQAALPTVHTASAGSAGAKGASNARPTSAESKPDAQAGQVATRPASSQTTKASAEARAMLEEGDTRMAAVRSGTGDLQGARAAYERVLELAPGSGEAQIARARLEEIDTREEVERLRRDIADYEARRQADLDAARKSLEDLEARKDPLRAGRWIARGWLERGKARDGSEQWLIRWAGEPTAEIVCTSGRYDLSIFADYELGIAGTTTPGNAGRPKVVDASRIEVLSGRRSGR